MHHHLSPPAIYAEPARRTLRREEMVGLMRQALAEMEKINAILDGVIEKLEAEAKGHADG